MASMNDDEPVITIIVCVRIYAATMVKISSGRPSSDVMDRNNGMHRASNEIAYDDGNGMDEND